MPYLKSDIRTARNPKVKQLRVAMRWSLTRVVGFLHLFWHTVLESSPSGDIAALTPDYFASELDETTESVTTALKHMERLRLLDRRGEHLLVHDWLEYVGDYLRDSLYRRQPQKWQQVCELHRQSPDCQPTVSRQTGINKPDKPDKQTNNSGCAASVGVGGQVFTELERLGVGGDALAELTVKDLTVAHVRTAHTYAEKHRKKAGNGLFIKLLLTAKQAVNVEWLCEAINAGEVVTVAGHRVEPYAVGHNANDGLHIYADSSKGYQVAFVPAAALLGSAIAFREGAAGEKVAVPKLELAPAGGR